MVILKDGASINIEVTVNGKVRAPVIVWRRGTEETLLVDSANLVSARERDQLVDRLPEGVRREAAGLLAQIGLEVAKADAGHLLRAAAGEQETALGFVDPEPWPVAVDLATVLTKIVHFIRRYIALPEAVADALSVWIILTYVMKAFSIAPYIIIRSPIMRCGKSLLVEVLELMIYRPFSTVSASAATLFRVIHESQPTVLMDEAEVLGSRDERAQDIRAILNAGYKRGPGVPRCVGDDHHVERFQVFGAKVIAAIGRLWDTLEDRSLIIELKRKRKDEPIARFRHRQAEAEAVEIRRQLFRWAQDHVDELAGVMPALPEFLDDRAQDSWEPLFAIAQLAGDGWSERLLRAARALNGVRVEDGGTAVQLLRTLEALFASKRVDRVASQALVEHLRTIDCPWTDWKTPITTTRVAAILKPFDISPKTVRFGVTTAKGYLLDDCQDAFSRYLGPETATCVTSEQGRHDPGLFGASQGDAVTVRETPEKPPGASTVTPVTDVKQQALPQDATEAAVLGAVGPEVVAQAESRVRAALADGRDHRIGELGLALLEHLGPEHLARVYRAGGERHDDLEPDLHGDHDADLHGDLERQVCAGAQLLAVTVLEGLRRVGVVMEIERDHQRRWQLARGDAWEPEA